MSPSGAIAGESQRLQSGSENEKHENLNRNLKNKMTNVTAKQGIAEGRRSRLKLLKKYLLFSDGKGEDASNISPPKAAAEAVAAARTRSAEEGANQKKNQLANGTCTVSNTSSTTTTNSSSGYNTSTNNNDHLQQQQQPLQQQATTLRYGQRDDGSSKFDKVPKQVYAKPICYRSTAALDNSGSVIRQLQYRASTINLSRQSAPSHTFRQQHQPHSQLNGYKLVAVQPPLVPMMIDDDDDADVDAEGADDCEPHDTISCGFVGDNDDEDHDAHKRLGYRHNGSNNNNNNNNGQHLFERWPANGGQSRATKGTAAGNENEDSSPGEAGSSSLSTSAATSIDPLANASIGRLHYSKHHQLHHQQQHQHQLHSAGPYLSLDYSTAHSQAHTFVWHPTKGTAVPHLHQHHHQQQQQPAMRISHSNGSSNHHHQQQQQYLVNNSNGNQSQQYFTYQSPHQFADVGVVNTTHNHGHSLTPVYYPTPFLAPVPVPVPVPAQQQQATASDPNNNHLPATTTRARSMRQWPPPTHQSTGASGQFQFQEQIPHTGAIATTIATLSAANGGGSSSSKLEASIYDSNGLQQQQQVTVREANSNNNNKKRPPNTNKSMANGHRAAAAATATTGAPSGSSSSIGASSGQLGCCGKLAKLLLFISNALFWCAGIALGAWGILALVDDHKYNLSQLLVFEHTSRMSLFQLLAWSFITLGCAAILVGFCGCSALFKNNRWILGLYIFLILTIFALDLATGLLAIIFQERLVANVRLRLVNKLRNEYGVQASFTAAVDYIQTRYECCGLDGHFDYDQSLWRLQRLGGFEATVARTCCHLRNTFDDQAHVNPRPVNESMCQSTDVRFHQSYRYRRGCLDDLERLIRHKIWTFTIGCGAVGAVILVSLFFATCFCRSIPSGGGQGKRSNNDPQQNHKRILTSNFTSGKKHQHSAQQLSGSHSKHRNRH